jgi:hyaluronan synthase
MRATNAGGVLAVAVTVLATLAFHAGPWPRPPSFATAFFDMAALILILQLTLAAKGRRFGHLPVAPGRVVAIIPTYNEDPELLHRCIRSLLDGTIVPDVIHIVDDGSAVPAPRLEHPTVVWHVQPNRGKRVAQVVGCRDETSADFILTVDSDSIADPGALEAALRAMSDARVQAVTATCVVRNRTTNLLTRLTDLEVVTGNMVFRKARSVLGAVAPTSGPFALYRAPVLFDNVDDYLSSGTYGDDRRLTHYALRLGHVVASDEAVVAMTMPSTVPGLVRQRTRWFQGYFRYLGWEIRYLTGVALLWRVWNVVLLVTFPVVAAYALVVIPLLRGQLFWEGWAYWVVLLYAQSLHYLASRPAMTLPARFATWLCLTPLLLPYQLGLIRPAMYYAVTRTRSLDWVTRDLPAPAPAAIRSSRTP